MRQRPFKVASVAAAAGAALLLLGGSESARAQGTAGTDAGIFLLLPTGAEAVGMGQAVVAVEGGSEGVWWNPAAIASQTKHELAVHYSQTVAGNDALLAFLIPSRRSGSLAFSINILDFGSQPVTDNQNNEVGVLFPRDLVFATTYAVAFAERLNVGFSFKVLQLRTDCTGQCLNVGTFVNSSNAADAGIQYRIAPESPFTFGVAVRNFGGTVKTGSSDTRDELPTQTDAGVIYHVLYLDKYLKDTQFKAAGSVVTTRGVGGVAVHLGGDMVYQSDIHLRVGYVADDKNNNSSTSVGFGIQSGRLVFDYAQLLSGASQTAGTTPKYLSLRYLF